MENKREIDGEYLEVFHAQLEHSEQIFVRDVIDVVPGRYQFSDLTVEQRMVHINKWVLERRIPLFLIKTNK